MCTMAATYRLVAGGHGPVVSDPDFKVDEPGSRSVVSRHLWPNPFQCRLANTDPGGDGLTECLGQKMVSDRRTQNHGTVRSEGVITLTTNVYKGLKI